MYTICNSTNPRAVLSVITLQFYTTIMFIFVDTQANISHASWMLGLWATPHKVKHPSLWKYSSWIFSQTEINCTFFVQSPCYWVFNTNFNKNFMHWHVTYTGQNLDTHHSMGTCVIIIYLLIKHVNRITTKISQLHQRWYNFVPWKIRNVKCDYIFKVLSPKDTR